MTRIFPLFFRIIFTSVIFGVLVSCTLLPETGRRRPRESRLVPAKDSKATLHVARHPARAHSGEPTLKTGKRDEISMDSFFSHPAHRGKVNALVVSRDGLHAYSGGVDGTVVESELLRASDGGRSARQSVKTRMLLQSAEPILTLSLSQDGKKLAIAQFSSVSVYDLQKRKVTNRLTRAKGRIDALAWDPRGELLLLGRADGDVFAWNLVNGKFAGQNSSQALERYEGGISPIIRLAFHPSARSFFVAERSGVLSIWRLLRTEREMGLRDETAQLDEKRIGRQRTEVARLNAEIDDLWIDKQAEELFASAKDGLVYRWKIRGLQLEQSITIGRNSTTSLRGVDLFGAFPDFINARKGLPLLAASGRGQRISFWCRLPQPAAQVDINTVTVLSEENKENEQTSRSEKPLPPGLVAKSQLFENTLDLLRTGERSSLLWAAEKTGNLLTFDVQSLTKHPIWLARARGCRG